MASPRRHPPCTHVPPTCARTAQVPRHACPHMQPVHSRAHRSLQAHLGAAAAAAVTGSCQLSKLTRVTCGDRKKKSLSRSFDACRREKAVRGRGGTEPHRDPAGAGLQQGRAAAPWRPPALPWPWSRSPKVAPVWEQGGGLCTDGGGCNRGVLQRGGLTAGGVGDGGVGDGGGQRRRQGPHAPAACSRPEIAPAAERAAFPLNGKSGRNLGPFQSPPSRALAAVRRQERRWAGGAPSLGWAVPPPPRPAPRCRILGLPCLGPPQRSRAANRATSPRHRPRADTEKNHLMGLG